MAKNLPRAHAREGPAPRVENENSLPFATLETRPKLAQIDGNGTDGGAPDGYESTRRSDESTLARGRDPSGGRRTRAASDWRCHSGRVHPSRRRMSLGARGLGDRPRPCAATLLARERENQRSARGERAGRWP